MNGLTNSLKTAEDYLQQAEIYQSHWQWEQALFCYQRAKNLQPLSWKALNRMGEVLANLERWEEAISIYRQALKLNPQFDWSYHHLGVALDRLGRFAESDFCYEKLIELNPQFWQTHCNDSLVQQQYGQFLFRKEQWEKAESVFRRVIELEPSSYSGCYGLGESLWQQKKWETIAAYCRIRELAPESPEIRQKLQEITDFFHNQLLPDHLSAQQAYELAEAFTQLEQWDQAVDYYRLAQTLQSNLTDIPTKPDASIANHTAFQFTLSKIPQGRGNLIHKRLNYATSKQQNALGAKFSQAHDRSSLIAGITEVVSGGVLKGWVFNSANPSQSVGLKVLMDGEQIAIVEAGQVHTSPHHSISVDSPKEFEVVLPPILKNQLLLDGGVHILELIPVNPGIGSGQPVAMQVTLPRIGFGRLDVWEHGCLRGWALPDHHSGVATLDVYINDVFFNTIKANLPRPDLLRYGIGDGHNGFEILIPPVLTQGKASKVDVFFAGTTCRLQRSPISLELSQEEIEKQRDRTLSKFSSVPKLIAKSKPHGITIIIPIFNAYDEVQQCIRSVIEHTSIQAKLLLINDASTDDRISSLLQWASNYSNVTVINNKENLGYTKTINSGIKFAKEDDVVLLNSDTIVGPRWLQNLQIAAYHDVDIATVTAISDNAGAFSVPEIGCANEMPLWLSAVEMARAVSYNSQALYPEVPTGNGFCLYIRRAALAEVGLFDEEAFPRGYGEENDFCMRALRTGWRHVIDDRTLVRHVRSASFQGEKEALITAGRQVVDERYPEYKVLIRTFTQSPELQAIRYNVRQLTRRRGSVNQKNLPRVLYVISTRTGGTPQTNEDLMRGLADRYHPLLLHCDGQEIRLYDTRSNPHQVCERVRLQNPISPTTHRSSEYDKILSGILVQYGIELLHIRHIAWHSLSLPFIAKQLGIPVVLSFHDFYTICPTVNLLDENQFFCGGQCTATDGQCHVSLWQREMPPLKHQFIRTWQGMMIEMMKSVDAFVTTSSSTQAQLQAIYPMLQNAPFWIIPHGRDFPQLDLEITSSEQSLHPHQPLRILFPGNINLHKGAELIAALHQLDINKRFEFHFLGTTDRCLAAIGHHHGNYQREDYHALVQQIQPHYVGIFSIWPETYCHTLTESWASGIPVIAIDKGAVGERIRQHQGGWLLDSTIPEEIFTKLIKIADDTTAYFQKIAEVHQWQQSYGQQNTISTMAAKYHQLYQTVSTAALAFTTRSAVQQPVKVGVFTKRDRNNQATPSVHIRVLEWLEHAAIQQQLAPQFLMVDAFLQDKNRVLDIEVVLVQRNVIEPQVMKSFIAECQERDLPIIFELDDDLMHVPAAKDPEGDYARTATAIQQLIQAATMVIVSTEPLADLVRPLNPQVTIIPNALSEFVWFRPIAPVENVPVAKFVAAAATLKVLYMGNPTHIEDLAMIRPVFERLNREQYPVTLFVIGGEPENETQSDWYQRLAIPNESRHYPEFVKWFRTVAAYCDLAIAPLVDTEFNRCKSALKFIQYSAVSLPGLYSDCVPYRDIVENRVNGLLVQNTETAWYEAIVNCYENRNTLSEFGEAAKEFVKTSYLMTNYADAYVDVFKQVTHPITEYREAIETAENHQTEIEIVQKPLTIRQKRQRVIQKVLDIPQLKILEIGAFDYPTYLKEQASIWFMDWFSKEEHLVHHATAPERADRAIEVDYVIKHKNFACEIDQKFDLVIANHVVEHIPDLVRWLQNISSVLNQAGSLFLAVPHKDYTFDKIRRLTSIAEVIRGYDEDLKSPTVYQVFDHFYHYRPIRASHIWDNEDYHTLLSQKRIATAKEAIKRAESEIMKQGYVDIHCNVFNYESFLELCDELYTSNYIDLRVAYSQDVERPDNEFYVILQKTNS